MRSASKLCLGIVAILVALPFAGYGVLSYQARQAPKPPLLEDVPFSSAVFARDNDMLTIRLAEDGVFRLPAVREKLPDAVVDATLLYEDRYFYRHPGVNPFSLIRAAWASFTGERPIGASTVSMQLARRLLGLDTRTPAGKWRQIREALRYEAHYSKDEILTAYLSVVPYGGNIEGIEAAARLYFGKPAAALTVNEAVALSVVPQNPVKRHPVTGEDFQAARLRAGEAMLAEGLASPRLAPILKAPLAVEKHVPFEAPHFTRRVSGLQPDARTIETALSLPLNRAVTAMLRESVASTRTRGIENVAAMVLDARTSEVVAYVGSADFFSDSVSGEVDGAAAPRSPGSTLKPFIYALALDQGRIHSRTVLMDGPSNYAGYEPLNEDRRFEGPLDATTALNRSRNIPAIEVARMLKPDLYDFLKAIDVPLPHPRDWYGLSIVLGSAEVSMDRLVSAYSAFLTQGVFSTPQWSRSTVRHVRPILSPEASAIVREMLKEGGTRLTVNGVSLPLAWKTGTSNGYRDAWTIGFAGPYIVGVWTGNFSGRSADRLRGASLALPLWQRIAMRTLHEPSLQVSSADAASDPIWDRMPEGVTEEAVCRQTGDLAVDTMGRELCRDTVKAYFIPGKSPIAPTGLLEEIRLDPVTGLRTCPTFTGETVSRFVPRWPAQWVPVLQDNGIATPPLPPLHPVCLADHALPACTLSINRPAQRRVWVADPKTHQARVPLSAITERGDSHTTLYWFSDGACIATTRPGETAYWLAAPGTRQLTVTDEHGRTATRVVRIVP